MSATGLEVFDRTLQATNIWLDDVMRELNWSDRHRAYHALRAVLHALRDRMPVEESAHFAAQLPMLVRGLYYEGWRPAAVPVRERKRDEFLAHITDAFVFDVGADSAEIVAGVLRMLNRQMTEGAIQKVRSILPEPIRGLWPAVVASA